MNYSETESVNVGKLRIISNFFDYYDLLSFSYAKNIYHRFDCLGIKRSSAFKLFNKHEILTPTNGLVKDIILNIDGNDELIIYLNEYSHRGEDKIKIKKCDINKQYYDKYCSLYINTEKDDIKGLSTRYLQIGNRSFWVEYASYDDWRSNYGENGYIKVIDEVMDDEKISLDVKYPVFAIDFVKNKHYKYAIDFNSAPLLKGTGIESILSASDVINLILEKLNEKQ